MYEGRQHRRGMETEGKAKVGASVWGTNFVNLFVLPWSFWKKQLNSAGLFGSGLGTAFFAF